MIIGNKKQFAIECIIEENNLNSQYIFGKIAIWLDNEKLGESELTVILKIPVTHFLYSLNSCGNRKVDNFETNNSEEIFNFLEIALWGDPDDDKSLKDLIEISKKYEKFNICINFSESFDGTSLYLIEDGKEERFIWKTIHSKKIKEINLSLGTYEKVVISFLNWFDNQTQCDYL